MTVAAENRWRRRLRKENDDAGLLRGQMEVVGRPSVARPAIQLAPSGAPSRAQVSRWMRLHADEYETATALVEGANAEFDIPASWLDDDSHWIWDVALFAK